MTRHPPSVEVTFPDLKKLLEAPGKRKVTLSTRTVLSLLDLYLQSFVFDEAWYVSTYPDVAEGIRRGNVQTARQHFLEFGYLEGRLPAAPDFDAEWYTRSYPDVAEGIASGLLASPMEHFVRFGYREGRHPVDVTAPSGPRSDDG